jgi:ABC-type phosphate transport system substrate-binding protein
MDVAYMLEIVKAGIASIENNLVRELTVPEKREILVGAVTKWNEANPKELIVIPAIYLED